MVARFIVLCTDDQKEAFDTFKEKQKEEPKRSWACAEVRHMKDPPRTKYKWCVFRLY